MNDEEYSSNDIDESIMRVYVVNSTSRIRLKNST